MYYESLEEIPLIASRAGASIFVLPPSQKLNLKNAILIEPDKKTVITIEQIREVLLKLNTKQLQDIFIVIRPADLMNDEAANALLKNLEEPKDKVHFVLVTDAPSRLLPTILSRAGLYLQKQPLDLKTISLGDAKAKDLAKRLMVAKPKDLVLLAEEITKPKKDVRNNALTVLSIAIEMLYKTYFLTNREIFLKKIPKFLTAYDNIAKNGHIKLHLVADLC